MTVRALDRFYALDLLHRAGTAYDVRDIAVIASIIPVLEADIIAEVERPIGGVDVSGVNAIVASVQAICVTRIGTGCHRPEIRPPAIPSTPGHPAAAPAPSGAAGGGLSGE